MYEKLGRDGGPGMYPEGTELPEDNRTEEAGAQPGIGARIVAIPAEMNRLSMIRPPAASPEPAGREPGASAPDFQRLVDIQRQQQLLGELTRPTGRPPVLQQPSASNSYGRDTSVAMLGGGGGNAFAPAPASRTAQPPAPVDTSRQPLQAAAAVNTAGKSPAPGRTAATAQTQPPVQGAGPAEKRGSVGSTAPQGSPGFVDRTKGHLPDEETGSEDSLLSLWQHVRGDKQGSPATLDQGSKNAQRQPGAAEKGGSPAQRIELPKKEDGNFGPRSSKGAERHDVPLRKSSDNGNNVYVPPKGQQIMDLITGKDGGYILDGRGGTDGKGTAQCVQLIKTLVGAPPTSEWREGQKVTKDANIAPGTVIATFENGRYPQLHGEKATRNQHAAIYLGQTEEGIWVVEQASVRDKNDKRPVIQARLIRWDRTDRGRSNNGNAFSAITWGPQGKAGTPRR
ncbi:MAG TPA: BPSL0067 family protein [Candidatus Saccharimonadales bacterium]|jgi:hypothetical protein|nr:BPSL0067 family protein [Candidatus Saccharimonadales bacterium]